MVGKFHVCWAPRELCTYVQAMPTHGALPERAVLVPRPRMGDEIRRQLAKSCSGCLVGTRIVTPWVLAETIVRSSGIDMRPGEELLREHRIAQLVEDGLDPHGFGRALLRETVGWPAAFAASIEELEWGGLRPGDLPTEDSSTRGIRSVWEASDAAAGCSWTRARTVQEAARRLAQSPALLRNADSHLAIVTMQTPVVVARMLAAIPDVEVVLLAARPMHAPVIEHVARLFGAEAVEAVMGSAPFARGRSDLAVASTNLFSLDVRTHAEDRLHAGPRPDGTLTLEELDGVRAELDAAADWVARQVLAGIEIDRIAVLVPVADPWCGLVEAALRGLDWGDEHPPIAVAGGASLEATPTGTRIALALTALEQHLSADALIEVLSSVQVDQATGARVSRSRVFELVHTLGSRGGSSAHPEGALQWRTQVAEAELRLAAPIVLDAFVDQQEHVERRRARLLETLHAVRPALLALCNLADSVARADSLAPLLASFIEFATKHLSPSKASAAQLSLFEQRLTLLTNDATCARARGRAVLGVLRRVLADTRTDASEGSGRGIYVGTLDGAAGCSFDAVRIIGLAEGSIPPTLRGDPVLAEDTRRRLLSASQASVGALGSLQALDLVFRGAERQLSMSASRLALDRTVREPSSVFLDVGAALDRLDGSSRVPSMATLRRREMRPAADDRARVCLLAPQRAGDWLDRLAVGLAGGPSCWRAPRAVVAGDGWRLDDGLFPDDEQLDVGGLDPSRPTSTWRLHTLLSCPHRYLYEHVLAWSEPMSTPPGHELEPSSFGRLIHDVAEQFFRQHGTAFARREASLVSWRACAAEIASAKLSELLVTRAFDSGAASDAVRRKLIHHVERLIEQSWLGGARRFAATEWGFGVDAPVRIALAGGELYVRGRVDLIEVHDHEAFVVDVKTGRCRPRRGADLEATHRIDLQLGIYAHVVQRHAAALGVPARVGAGFRHTDDRKGTERSFRGDDGDALRAATVDWLETARGLLATRSFPRTPDDDECRSCPFRPMCPDSDRRRSRTLLRETDEPALVRFRALKETR